MQIQVNSVNNSIEPTAKGGKYGKLKVSFSYDGKNLDKTIVSFGSQSEAYKVLVDAKKGEFYEVEDVKNNQGYFDWISAKKLEGVQVQETVKTTPRSTYETPEERALRQKLIVRQSSVTSAIGILELQKAKPSLKEVLEYAEDIYNWVFESYPVDPIEALKQMDNDIPF